jgi:L-alanine-DL-glutamate epimerase-like enolase superfamily enzyme
MPRQRSAARITAANITAGDPFEGVPKCEGGFLRLSDRPGHGVALEPDAEKKYRMR